MFEDLETRKEAASTKINISFAKESFQFYFI